MVTFTDLSHIDAKGGDGGVARRTSPREARTAATVAMAAT